MSKGRLYDGNNHPKINITNTGYKNAETALKTIELIKRRSIIYQKALINTLYNRAKYNKNINNDMRQAMSIFSSWLRKHSKDKPMYEYLDLKTISKFEKLANIYNVSRVSRGLDKSSKSDIGFLVAYKKYGKSKMPFIPKFSAKPSSGDYDSFRQSYLNARIAQMKKMKIPLYYTSGKFKGLPTKFHVTLIMNAWSPDKNLIDKIYLVNDFVNMK